MWAWHLLRSLLRWSSCPSRWLGRQPRCLCWSLQARSCSRPGLPGRMWGLQRWQSWRTVSNQRCPGCDWHAVSSKSRCCCVDPSCIIEIGARPLRGKMVRSLNQTLKAIHGHIH